MSFATAPRSASRSPPRPERNWASTRRRQSGARQAPATISRVTARLLDGKAVAQQILDDIATKVGARVAQGKPRPKLATIIVGDSPASARYVRSKQKNARQVGIDSVDHRLPTETSTEQLLELIGTLNRDESVSGILVQQPLPMQIDLVRVVIAVDPVKDVDGFHPFNAGLVAQGLPGGIEPCTPSGIVELLARGGVRIEGANAVWSAGATSSGSRPRCFCSNATPP